MFWTRMRENSGLVFDSRRLVSPLCKSDGDRNAGILNRCSGLPAPQSFSAEVLRLVGMCSHFTMVPLMRA